MIRSISNRLTILLTAANGGALMIAGTVLYFGMSQELERATQVDLLGKVQAIRHFVEEATESEDLEVLAHRMDDLLIGHEGLRVWLMNTDDRVVYGKSVPPAELTPVSARLVRDNDGVALWAIRGAVNAGTKLGIATVVVAVESSPRVQLLQFTFFLICGVAAATIVLAGSLGWIAVRCGLRPLHRMSEEVSAMSPSAPGQHLTELGLDLELIEIAASFNSMLSRVERAHRQAEAFNADVAHELRSPIATLISCTQLALSRRRPAEQLKDALISNLEVLEDLKSMVNDMLFLAQADHGALTVEMATVDLRTEVLKVVEFFEAWIAHAQIWVKVIGTTDAICAPALIRRAVSNCLSNAIKYTQPGGTILITIRDLGDNAEIGIDNPGTPITDEVRQRMFDRFFRGDEARGRIGESFGLGLAIVRAIAHLHNGRAYAESTPNGTRVVLVIGRKY